MSSGSGSRRGPKPARCPRAAKKGSDEKLSRQRMSSSRSSSAESSTKESEVSSAVASSTVSTLSPAPATWNSYGFTTAEQTVMAPDMNIENGDRKETYQLADKGKFVMITRKNGDLVYMLRCVDGRRVYIEKTDQGACLILTNQKGKITKALAGAY